MNALSAALFTKLTAASSLTGLLAAGTAGVYEQLAPENADPPYVIFQEQARTPYRHAGGGGVTYERVLYTVKGIAEGPSMQVAGSIADRIDQTLDTLGSLTISGYTLMRCERITSINYIELDAGKRFNHAGATYRLDVLPS